MLCAILEAVREEMARRMNGFSTVLAAFIALALAGAGGSREARMPPPIADG